MVVNAHGTLLQAIRLSSNRQVAIDVSSSILVVSSGFLQLTTSVKEIRFTPLDTVA